MLEHCGWNTRRCHSLNMKIKSLSNPTHFLSMDQYVQGWMDCASEGQNWDSIKDIIWV